MQKHFRIFGSSFSGRRIENDRETIDSCVFGRLSCIFNRNWVYDKVPKGVGFHLWASDASPTEIIDCFICAHLRQDPILLCTFLNYSFRK